MPRCGWNSKSFTVSGKENLRNIMCVKKIRHFESGEYNKNELEFGEEFDEVCFEKKFLREDFFLTSKIWNTNHEPKYVSI